MLFIVQVHGFALDEQLLDLGLGLEWISIGHHQIGPLAFFNGPDPVRDAPNLGRI